MKLDGPSIGIAPQIDGTGLVGLPIWLWNKVSPSTWGPITRTAAVPGRSVTATATAQKIVWTMGDGSSVTCTTPGTPYQPSYGNKKSPDCGYSGYSQPSSTQAEGRYTVTATTSWLVTWSGGGGTTGSQTVDLSSTATIDIDELQVITS
ncbi:ATP/GTP-binding protein [Micromonospora arida]|uniref:ATP/GTP-binding protein n=2 Tax=Micromonospora arida TaxID=2203715 RepID=A0A3N9WQ43_9ACTN|nr:ATP/GTP-binding protein [Micromonospora arida]